MIKWKFDKNNSIQQSYQVIPEGYYQVQIENAVETVSDSGNQMIRMSLNVIGYNVKVRHHLTFSPKHRVLVNKVLSDIYSSFNISVGNLDPQTWIGKIGVAKLEQDNFNGRTLIFQPRLPAFYNISQKIIETRQTLVNYILWN